MLADAVKVARVTRAVIVERGALARLPRMLADIGHHGPVQVIADPATMIAAGRRVVDALRQQWRVEKPIVLQETPRPKPRVEIARDIAAELSGKRALPLAVGSGVINDLTKFAAHVARLPYVSVATAASMDGYAASGAALLDSSFKRTFACPPPVAVVADLDVIAHAPPRMAAWGYGDLAGKLIAGADWLLADAAGEDPLDAASFALVQDHVRTWLAEPAQIAAHEPEAMRHLVEGLLTSGFAMQARGDSRPASGSEHQLSHLWEMDRLEVDGEPAAHGACVGVATVAMLALYEWFLAQDVGSPSPIHGRSDDASAIEAELQSAFADPVLIDSARVETTAKLARASHREQRVRALVAAWPTLRARVRDALVAATTMERWLADARAARHPDELGIALDKLACDYRRARLIRRRYTILDCLEDLGWLDAAVAALFTPDGFWSRRATRMSASAIEAA